MWLLNLFTELGLILKTTPQLLWQSWCYTSKLQSSESFLYETYSNWSLFGTRFSTQVRHVHTQDQLVDLLTKPLSREHTKILRNKSGLADESAILQGHIKEDCMVQNQTSTKHI
jgi:hypothetical protein